MSASWFCILVELQLNYLSKTISKLSDEETGVSMSHLLFLNVCLKEWRGEGREKTTQRKIALGLSVLKAVTEHNLPPTFHRQKVDDTDRQYLIDCFSILFSTLSFGVSDAGAMRCSLSLQMVVFQHNWMIDRHMVSVCVCRNSDLLYKR